MTSPVARNFNNTASVAQLAAPVSPSDVAFSVSGYANFPSAPFVATVDRNTATEEIVLVTAVLGSTLTVTRGYDGTAAQTHLAGAKFEHTAVALDFREANAHTTATTNVHGTGAGSAVVGTTTTQTLTNKTLSAPTLTGTTTAGQVNATGVSVSGSSSLGTASATTFSVSGAATASTAPTLAAHIARKAEVDAAITTAASDATTKANAAQTAAQTFATNADTTTLNSAKTYADGKVNTDGWQDVTPAGGWTAFGAGFQGLKVWKIGNTVFFSGLVSNTSGYSTAATVATIPVGYRPSAGTVMMTGMVNGGVLRFDVRTDGIVQSQPSGAIGAGTYHWLAGTWNIQA